MNLESWLRDAIVHPADGPLWFVLNLMGSIILAPVIYFAIRNIKAGVVSLIALTIIAFTVNPPHNSLLSTTILFMVGGMLSIHCRGWVERKYGKKTKCVAGITILIILLITNSYDIYSSGGGEYIITFTVLAAAVWVICDTEPLFTLFNYKDYQFWVYCTHSFILESMEKIFLVICGKSVLAAAIDYILMPIVCIALVCMVGAAVSKGAPRTWKALTGNR